MYKVLFAISLLISMTAFGQPEKPKLEISELTRDFYIYTTYGDPGNGSLYPANGMYLVTSEGVVLFDSPWDKTQFQPLLDTIQARHHQKVIMCIATHFHDDRTAGLEYYRQKGIKTYTTKQTDELSKVKNQPRAEYLIQKDTVFNIGQYHFETFYPGKGHAPDNIVIWFEKEKVLYGGCFIKSTETNSPGNLSDANIEDWIKSIKKVQAKCQNPKFVIPGHQDWSSKKSLQHTLAILKKYLKENPKDK
ncbi:BlaB/IND/MUS family subclass B1 metallo-beta-lactamase [Flavobacterium wongokense]|uniref:BlaB/IND/MUS family subclass B1 metallo-beta-lactamase n=1 Tax=Flavobacterium wongokense TaxID=2910674 RepID=UPI00351CCD2A